MSVAKFDNGEAAAKVAMVLEAAEASILFARNPGESGATAEDWRERAAEQLDLARRLMVLVSSQLEQLDLLNRAGELVTQLEHERAVRLLTRLPNRRLYDNEEKRYITLADVRRLVLERAEFFVIDKKNNVDVTRYTLWALITELERSYESLLSEMFLSRIVRVGVSALSRDFLSEVIRLYGSTDSRALRRYLEQSLQIFASQQRDARERMSRVGDPESVEAVNHLARRNYQRWRSVQEEIYRTLMGSAARGRGEDEAWIDSDRGLEE